jgi:hypothetical protein
MSLGNCCLVKVKVKPYCPYERKWSFALFSTVIWDVHRNWLSDCGFLEILRCGSRIVHRGGSEFLSVH